MKYFFPCFFLLFLIISKVNADPLKKIAVLNFKAIGIEKNYALLIKSQVEYIFYESQKFKLLDRNRVIFLIDDYKLSKQTLQNEIKIGKLLAADYVVSGSIIYSKYYNIIIKIIDIKTGEIFKINIEKFKLKEYISKKLKSAAEQAVIMLERMRLEGNRKKIGLRMDLYAGYVRPIKEFKEKVEKGFSGSLFVGKDNFLFQNYFVGFKTGYYYFKAEGENPNMTRCSIMLFMINNGYSMKIYDNFKVEPFFGLGYSRNNYYKIGYGPIIEVGMGIGYFFNSYLNFSFNYIYGSVLEKNINFHYNNFLFGIGCNL